MEPLTGLEPVTSSLPRRCSTTELQGHFGAGDGTRTRDPQLGRLMLYQLSYSRVVTRSPPMGAIWWGEVDLNHCRQCRRVYSPLPLATRASPRRVDFRSWRRDLNPQPAAYKAAALPIEPRQRRGLMSPEAESVQTNWMRHHPGGAAIIAAKRSVKDKDPNLWPGALQPAIRTPPARRERASSDLENRAGCGCRSRARPARSERPHPLR